MANWNVFIDDSSETLALVSVDLEAAQALADRGMTHRVTCVMSIGVNPDNGFPDREELDMIHTLEETLAPEGQDLGRVHVGHRIEGTTCRIHLYTASPAETVRAVQQAVENLGRDASVEAADEPDWETYGKELFPSPDQMQRINNRRVIEALREAGDTLEKDREVDHWLYFAEEAQRDKVAEFLIKQGFKIVDRSESTENELPFGLNVSRIDSVEIEAIDMLTIKLKRLAQAAGGDYDGWETIVVKE